MEFGKQIDKMKKLLNSTAAIKILEEEDALDSITTDFIKGNASAIDDFMTEFRLWMKGIKEKITKMQALLQNEIDDSGIIIRTYIGDNMLFGCTYVEGMSKKKTGTSTLVIEPYIDSRYVWRLSIFEREPNPLTEEFLNFLKDSGLQVTEDRMEGFERVLLSEEYCLDDIDAVLKRTLELYNLLF